MTDPDATTSTPTPDPETKPDARTDAPEPASGSGDGQLSDAGQRAIQREREARKEAERKAHELESAEVRRSVAADKGLTDEQAAFLTGETEDEIAEHADKLLAAFKSEPTTASRTPRERLKPGAAPGAEPKDYASIAEDVRKG